MKMEKEDSFQTLAGACFPTTIMVFCRSRVAATVKQSKITTLKTIIILNYSLDSGLLKKKCQDTILCFWTLDTVAILGNCFRVGMSVSFVGSILLLLLFFQTNLHFNFSKTSIYCHRQEWDSMDTNIYYTERVSYWLFNIQRYYSEQDQNSNGHLSGNALLSPWPKNEENYIFETTFITLNV